MKITLEIDDANKANALIEFLKSLSYVNVKAPKAKTTIPDWHIAILQQRLKDYKKNPGQVLDIDKALKQIEAGL